MTKEFVQPDETDWQIIDELSQAHQTNTLLAEKLGVSEGKVRQRLKKLQEANVLKIRALRNPDILTQQQLAFVATNITESRYLKQKAQEISRLKNVQSVSILSGQYDLMIEVLVSSNRGLIEFLTEELSKVEGISRTETFLILESI
ncbi:MAG: Lrp/AsnC family transcriptional regulator, partial [Sedimentisphaerales bacterium]|nr:Lrp/AsnC family transcriptional regulator [Sedimentisphaerales bacterium]